MAKQVEFYQAALEDAEQSRLWYEREEPGLGTRFLQELDESIDLIQEFPEVAAPYIRSTRRYVLRKFPFSIIYRVHKDLIEVVAIAHHSRRPDYWKDR